MTIELGSLFDQYTFRARVYPGLFACFPVVVTIVLLWPSAWIREIWSVVVTAGGAFFLANFVRSRGKYLEAKLIKKWDGLPTTHMLRHREAENPFQFRRRRQGIELVYGETLPTAEEEVADPKIADAAYIAATRSLIARVRGNTEKYPRVHEENINYGFRRNLLAIKTIALSILVVLTTADITVAVHDFRYLFIVALAVNLVLVVAWLTVVNENWVEQAGQSYAERLFDTLEEDGLAS